MLNRNIGIIDISVDVNRNIGGAHMAGQERILDLTKELGQLGDLIGKAPNLDDFLSSGLAWLGDMAPYDLATVWQIDGDQLRVRTAVGRLTTRKVLEHVVDLSKQKDLRRVLAGRTPKLNSEHDHLEGDGDLFDGVVELLPGHSCMVVPLYAGEQTLGLLSLDRNLCEPYSSHVLQLVELYGRILALGMLMTGQAQRFSQLFQEERSRSDILQHDLSSLDPVATLLATRSPALQTLLGQARAVAESNAPVLILGETGVGKEVLAQALHQWSRRSAGPFIRINCAAFPEGLLESEFFGHVRGAFTGAVRDRPGRLRAAHGGTLFLDEIGDMPLVLQSKLLRVLQEGSFEPVGSDQTIKVDVRILAATNVDLAAAIRAKTFREDLFYRINVLPLNLPPLHQRLEDLPLLAEFFLHKFQPPGGRAFRLGKAGMELLRAYPWPGNVRELGNVMERAAILATREKQADITPFLALAQLKATFAGDEQDLDSREQVLPLDAAMALHIRQALKVCGGKIYGADGAAALLGLKPSTLQSKMQKLKVKPSGR